MPSFSYTLMCYVLSQACHFPVRVFAHVHMCVIQYAPATAHRWTLEDTLRCYLCLLLCPTMSASLAPLHSWRVSCPSLSSCHRAHWCCCYELCAGFNLSSRDQNPGPQARVASTLLVKSSFHLSFAFSLLGLAQSWSLPLLTRVPSLVRS